MPKMKVLLTICMSIWTVVLSEETEIEQLMKKFEVIPDMLDEAPQEFLRIEFENGIIGEQGVELTPTQTKDAPTLTWTVESDSYYTVIMSNPDLPDRKAPIWREWLHWLVVNVPGTDLSEGELLDPYLGPATPKSAGLLRYVFLVYKQPGKLDFDEPVLNNTSVEGHYKFSAKQFAAKYHMDSAPVAGNIFMAQWDEFVPTIHRQFNVSVD